MKSAPIRPERIFGVCNKKRLVRVSTPSWIGCLSIAGLPPSIKINSLIPIYRPGWRGTVRVKCLAQEHHTMSPARARTRTARCGVERTNYEATAPAKLQIFNNYPAQSRGISSDTSPTRP